MYMLGSLTNYSLHQSCSIKTCIFQLLLFFLWLHCLTVRHVTQFFRHISLEALRAALDSVSHDSCHAFSMPCSTLVPQVPAFI